MPLWRGASERVRWVWPFSERTNERTGGRARVKEGTAIMTRRRRRSEIHIFLSSLSLSLSPLPPLPSHLMNVVLVAVSVSVVRVYDAPPLSLSLPLSRSCVWSPPLRPLLLQRPSVRPSVRPLSQSYGQLCGWAPLLCGGCGGGGHVTDVISQSVMAESSFKTGSSSRGQTSIQSKLRGKKLWSNG